MIYVTGGAGFIGSNLVHALCARGEDVVVVDDLTDGRKFSNLVGAPIVDFIDAEVFEARVDNGRVRQASAIFHQGACTDTTEWNGRHMMANNYTFSRKLLRLAESMRAPFVYASSASVYGSGTSFAEDPANEAPINVYAYSKWLFDVHVRKRLAMSTVPIVGLRYFNVYGPREAHKGRMASVTHHFSKQLAETGVASLFEGTDGYGPGEQRRDFVHVDDVVATNLWFLDNPGHRGIFNVGTGSAATFNDVANAAIAFHGAGEVRYIPFPESLQGSYQSFTEADLTALRATGCDVRFRDVAQGVPDTLRALRGS